MRVVTRGALTVDMTIVKNQDGEQDMFFIYLRWTLVSLKVQI